ncbi:hypothetical protein C8F04DRAFT_1362898 [Mycena alexandri]|uniref:Uncharacterized protein n=1 Tax=Mycena alexandri TaxID=1745969 RepID=A0AAD6SPK7_9AGAR|nr:hypothetical protein C8F04DRAFT_1362898 [Mycena alexandri]
MPARSKGTSSGSPAKKGSTSVSNSKQKKTGKKVKEALTIDDESETEYDSDALDDDSGDESKNKKKRKRKTESVKKTRSPKKKKTSDTDEEDFDLQDGQEIVGVVVKAPKTGLVPAGQISQNTFDFLMQLKDPKRNDREWFKLHDPVYRQAEKEWKDFVEVFTDLLVEVDEQIPPLPPKDVIHRIYRDTRFSNDKTPYKQNFSASFSRSGRKGIFAFFKPGNHSMIAAGAWNPAKNELDTIRSNIQRDPSRLRGLINDPVFVKYFGEPKPGARRNIFGREDELKVAPKGIPKTHESVVLLYIVVFADISSRNIDLLKCRSFTVSYGFKDTQVLSPDFKNTLAEMITIMMPFVHCLNDMMTIPPDDEDDEDEE